MELGQSGRPIVVWSGGTSGKETEEYRSERLCSIPHRPISVGKSPGDDAVRAVSEKIAIHGHRLDLRRHSGRVVGSGILDLCY